VSNVEVDGARLLDHLDGLSEDREVRESQEVHLE